MEGAEIDDLIADSHQNSKTPNCFLLLKSTFDERISFV